MFWIVLTNFNTFLEVTFRKVRSLASKYKIFRLWMAYIGAVNLTRPEDAEVKVVQ